MAIFEIIDALRLQNKQTSTENSWKDGQVVQGTLNRISSPETYFALNARPVQSIEPRFGVELRSGLRLALVSQGNRRTMTSSN
jgi:hypothetical protein